ncbi:hypothetical protein NEOLEDRAFT_382450 [Neolentinus lepideus HHB14362 ss-1]|uniref:Uncharacterized protein n=1 Tax=Neolentinus lepideus HHB14362 ss-1 TaxID=1314782 RepID=A0A165SD91_9AGAM|nr:hypothetical protein NEOLEDRAFT_382450 [Neolentinus lepideus HHB14362 ss-1]
MCENNYCKSNRYAFPLQRFCEECVQYGSECPDHPEEWYCSFCKDTQPICPTCRKRQLCNLDYRTRCRCGRIESCYNCLGFDDNTITRDLKNYRVREYDEDDKDNGYSEDDDVLETVDGHPAVRFAMSGCDGHGNGWYRRFCARCIEGMNVKDCDGCRNAFCKLCRSSRTCGKHGPIQVCKSCYGNDNCKRCSKRYRVKYAQEELEAGTSELLNIKSQ